MVRLSDPPTIIEFGHLTILVHRRELFAQGPARGSEHALLMC